MSAFDDIVWTALAGPHAMFALGTGEARRYAPGFSAIVGFADREQPNVDALSPFCDPGEHFYCDGWSGDPPPGWRVDAEDVMLKMIWDAPMPDDEAPEAVRLGSAHVAQALDLVGMTRPGPFGPRTLELGDYFGRFDDGQLVAMAGERLCAPPLREVSGVCTHPEFQGRGLARRLMTKLIRRALQRGETPCLHVMRDNSTASKLYRRMGFRIYRQSVVRVISKE
jgi:ribosomal protein S18 acetylase RimI-like enzyme